MGRNWFFSFKEAQFSAYLLQGVSSLRMSWAWQAVRSPRLSRKVEQIQQNRREERLARYQQVIALHRRGMSQAAIARRVGMGASTVQAWLAAGEFVFPQAA